MPSAFEFEMSSEKLEKRNHQVSTINQQFEYAGIDSGVEDVDHYTYL